MRGHHVVLFEKHRSSAFTRTYLMFTRQLALDVDCLSFECERYTPLGLVFTFTECASPTFAVRKPIGGCRDLL